MENKEITPVELCIEAGEVVKRYPVTEAMEIVRCRTAIFFHSTCFWVVSKPTFANNLRGGALYETLRWYCDYMDTREEHEEEEREKYDTIAAMVVNILTLPLDVFTDSDFLFDIADYILKKRGEFYERLAEEAAEPREDTEEDAIENANFEGEVLIQEKIREELEKAAAENGKSEQPAS